MDVEAGNKKDWVRQAITVVGATVVLVVAAVGIVIWMASSAVDHQIDRVAGAATTVKDAVVVVVEKGDAAKDKAVDFIDTVKKKISE